MVEDILTDDDFSTGFEPEVLPEGKYRMAVIKSNPRIKVSKTGNRYLTVAVAARETDTGERANSKLIYHSIPFEGSNRNGEPNRRMFAGFLSALGLEKEAVKSVYASLISEAPAADAIGDATEVTLTLNGDPISLEGREFMAKLKVEEYNGKESNKISSTWAVKPE